VNLIPFVRSAVIDLELQGGRAIVVGAGFQPHRAGHGRASALRLAAAGATVACVDIDPGRADDIVAEITAAGGRASRVIADVTDPSQAARAVDEAVAALGGVDVCVDIVGEAVFANSHEFPVDMWDLDLRRNLSQVFYVFKSVVPHMISQGTGGALTAITSVDGMVSSKYHAAYGSAKAGIISLVKTYSDEFGAHGIRVNAVAPGNVGGGSWGAPDVPFGVNAVNSLAPPRAIDIANAVLFLSSALAARITGQTLVVDGGASTRSPWGFTPSDLEQLRGGAIPGPQPGAWSSVSGENLTT
jgi:NAD(P)-dependent dehydrogenase (short-subunit alcohol dehydrogenase family)